MKDIDALKQVIARVESELGQLIPGDSLEFTWGLPGLSPCEVYVTKMRKGKIGRRWPVSYRVVSMLEGK